MNENARLSEGQAEAELETIRTELTDIIKRGEALERSLAPPVVQEAVLARRNAEDARMRFGVAQAKLKGFDPWANKVEAK